MTRHYQHVSRIALLLMLISLVNACGANTCRVPIPVEADRWYLEHLEPDPATIPHGVTIETVYDGIFIDAVTVGNSRPHAPLYLIVTSHNSTPAPFVQTELGFPVQPTTGLLRLTPTAITTGHVAADGAINWYPAGDVINAPLRVAIDSGLLDMVLRGYQTYAGNDGIRPASVIPPAPRRYSFDAYTGTERINLTMIQSFTLNPAYDPAAMERYQRACDAENQVVVQQFFAMLIGIGILFGAGVLIILIIVVRIVIRLVRHVRQRRR